MQLQKKPQRSRKRDKMLSSKRQMIWDEILDKSKHMLTFARNESWDELVEMEKVRSRLIGDFFKAQILESEAKEIVQDIQTIIEQDKEIMSHCLQQKSIVQNQLKSIVLGQKASSAYAENSV